MKRLLTVFWLLVLFAGVLRAQTPFVCGEQVVDADGNTYETVRIGHLCWMKSNVQAKTYSDGTTVAKAMIYSSSMNSDTNANLSIYGRLYTWFSAVNVPEGSDVKPAKDADGFVQGVCPEGWHIPTVGEIRFLNSNPTESLRSIELWLEPNNNTNSTGFTSLPAGYYNSVLGRFEGLLGQTYYWSDSSTTPQYAVACDINYFCDVAQDKQRSTGDAVSVRCVLEIDTCAEYEPKTCPGMPTVTDHEGNVYNTVLIGNQCWTKENMRCRTSPSGNLTECTSFPTELLQPQYFDNTSSTIPLPDRGLLYNWAGAMDTVFANQPDMDVSFANRMGICPEGWHVPSKRDWERLVENVASYNCFVCGDNPKAIAKALASKEYWIDYGTSDEACLIGYNLTKNNLTGFSAIPALCLDGHVGGIGSDGNVTHFWSSTSVNSERANDVGLYVMNFDTLYSGIQENLWTKQSLYSVRCLKDDENAVYLPTVTTSMIGCDGETGGEVTSDGGAEVTARGVVWSTSPNPTLEDNVTTDGTGTGIFTSSLGLTKGVRYYVRAYATNSEGTSYGKQMLYVNYDSLPCPATPTVTDHEGNVYNTVQIGDQCWTRENMRCTTSPSGRLMTSKYFYDNYDMWTDCPYVQHQSGSSTALNCASLSPLVQKTDYDNDTVYTIEGRILSLRQVGYEYNWCGAMDTVLSDLTEFHTIDFTNRRGICPEGWHVPSVKDWQILEDYINSYTCYLCDNTVGNNAKAFASKEYWKYPAYDEWSDCLPGKDTAANNKLGFNAIPIFRYHGSDVSDIYKFGSTTFWTSRVEESGYSPAQGIGNYYPWDVGLSSGSYMNYPQFVRCIRDEIGHDNTGLSTAELPTVKTVSVICDGGNAEAECVVMNDGGATVTARGVVWSTHKNPTLSDNYTEDAYGKGTYYSTITGLVQGTTYYVRAYATNSDGTAYGEEIAYTKTNEVVQTCPGIPTVTDHEGNVYNTVLIGTQCWTKENMRCKTSPKGNLTPGGDWSSSSSLIPRWYENNVDTIPTEISGLLYNLPGALDTIFTQRDTNSFVNHRGICPEGWHIPSAD